jgi:hypothetical protein
MPEAPWIRRWGTRAAGGDHSCDIKFTDHILREDGEGEDEFEEEDDQGGVDISEIRDEFQLPSKEETKKQKPPAKKQPIRDDHSPYLHSLELQ